MTPTRAQTDAAGAASSPRNGRTPRTGITARALLLVALACLVVLLIGVIWVLPDFKGDFVQGEDDAVSTPVQPAPPDKNKTRLAREKREAEGALQAFLRRQSVLEGQDVSTWAEQGYEQVLQKLAEADAAFGGGNFALATTGYLAAHAALDELEASKTQRLQFALAEGATALGNFDADGAKRRFRIALALDPGSEQARAGAARAENIAEVAGLLSRGQELEQAGSWQEAQRTYQQAVQLDPKVAAARQGVARTGAEIGARRFRILMSDALAAIQAKRFDAADQALIEASNLQPGSSDVSDARQRLLLALQEHRIAGHRNKAAAFAEAENWSGAAREYEAVLAIDSQAQFAVLGLSRSRKLERLHDQLDRYLAMPDRLRSAQPKANAQKLLGTAESLQETGPLLADKLHRLASLLELAQTPVRVLLRSNEMTDVVINRVGRFGRFRESTVVLLPGDYVVRGSRDGYRDVRLDLSVSPGVAGRELVVQCEERI